MQTFILRCPSVTYAQKGQRVLGENSIPSRLTRADQNGCAYGLEMNTQDREKALFFLKQAGILFETT